MVNGQHMYGDNLFKCNLLCLPQACFMFMCRFGHRANVHCIIVSSTVSWMSVHLKSTFDLLLCFAFPCLLLDIMFDMY